jgi:hypothetical protein
MSVRHLVSLNVFVQVFAVLEFDLAVGTFPVGLVFLAVLTAGSVCFLATERAVVELTSDLADGGSSAHILGICAQRADRWVVAVIGFGHGLRLGIGPRKRQEGVQRSVVTVVQVKRIQAKAGNHPHQVGFVALLQGVFETGSLAEDRCEDPDKSSSDQRKGGVRVNLQVESLLD